MVDHAARTAEAVGLNNVRVERRDFVADGTGLPNASGDYATLFNILHCEQPLLVLGEARRVLVEGGLLGIMHWNYDPATRRGVPPPPFLLAENAIWTRVGLLHLLRLLLVWFGPHSGWTTFPIRP